MSSKESSQTMEIIDDVDKYDKSFNILILGDCNVGKTSLIDVVKGNKFKETYNPTVGFDFFSLCVKIYDKIIKLQIWDISGQETYRSLINDFLKKTSLIILVYDITNIKSFENIDTWLKDIKIITEEAKIILVGNKSDLAGKRVVTEEKGKEKCESNHLTEFIECSSKNGINVKEIFINTAKILYDDLNNMNLENEINLDSKEDKNASSSNNFEDDFLIRESFKIKKKSCPCCHSNCC